MGLRIFLYSINLVFKQLGGAIRISGLLYLVSIVLTVICLMFFMPTITPGRAPSFSWQYVPILLAIVVIYLWIAVSWHRFVLLDEEPHSALPSLHGDRLLAYFGRGLQVGLVFVIVGIAISLVLGILIAINAPPPILTIVPLVMLFALILLSYRLAPVFPGAAIGKPIGIGAAWAATSGSGGTIVVLAIVSSIASIVIDLPAQLLQHVPAGGIFVLIWLNVSAWVKLMVGISILTTLYGVYVEKRAID